MCFRLRFWVSYVALLSEGLGLVSYSCYDVFVDSSKPVTKLIKNYLCCDDTILERFVKFIDEKKLTLNQNKSLKSYTIVCIYYVQ